MASQNVYEIEYTLTITERKIATVVASSFEEASNLIKEDEASFFSYPAYSLASPNETVTDILLKNVEDIE